MVKEVKSKRYIKQIGNPVKPGERYLHPLTLDIRTIDKAASPYIPTEFFLNEKQELELDIDVKKINTTNMTKEQLQLEMVLPKTVYNEAHLLYIYDIKTIDDLNNWINEQLSKDIEFETINRILNIYISLKQEEFTKNNNLLIDIYTLLLKKYKKSLNITDDTKRKLEGIIINYLKNNSIENYDFNLGTEILKSIN